MGHIVRSATLEDVKRIAPKFREADRQECLALTGREPWDFLPEAFLGIVDGQTLYAEATSGEPILLAGVARSGPASAVVWMAATPEIFNHEMAFLRRCRKMVDGWNTKYALLHNVADSRNVVHLRWLKWLGFAFTNQYRSSTPGCDFIEFQRTLKCASPQSQ